MFAFASTKFNRCVLLLFCVRACVRACVCVCACVRACVRACVCVRRGGKLWGFWGVVWGVVIFLEVCIALI